VDARPVLNLNQHLSDLLENAPNNDYIVGWLDTFAGGKNLGRGQIHAARNLKEGEDPNAQDTMKLSYQHLPDRLFGVMPKSLLHYFMNPFVNNLGWRAVNIAKYVTALRKHTFRQSHAEFHFLLDYVPNWERSFGRSGLIQYQSFLPKETAEDAWREMIGLSNRRGMPSYLGVTKRHRPDQFLLTHAVDGFSLALDFKVTDRKRAKLYQLLQDFDQIVINGGGRFYFAKNSETSAETTRTFLGAEVIKRFMKLKKRCDPHGLLESDLFRRVFRSIE
jgi:decaprenylphospho-beta-D-ribofuranose 2-oxidase